MPAVNRPIIAKFDCPDCGVVGTVHKYDGGARGKAELLYTRCGCGCDQRTGDKVQAKMRALLEKKTPELVPQPAPPPAPKSEEKKQPANDENNDFVPEPALSAAELQKQKLREILKQKYGGLNG